MKLYSFLIIFSAVFCLQVNAADIFTIPSYLKYDSLKKRQLLILSLSAELKKLRNAAYIMQYNKVF